MAQSATHFSGVKNLIWLLKNVIIGVKGLL